MKYFLIALILSQLIKCKSKQEDPYQVAKEFCDCMIKNQQKNGKYIKSGFCDSTVFGESRLLMIYFSENPNAYSKETLDSAKAFDKKIEEILDTTCFSKGI